MPNWKKVITSGSNAALNDITASGAISASTYYGDGSNLTGISSDPFPYTGSAVISGSLEVIGTTALNGDITGSRMFIDGGRIAIGSSAKVTSNSPDTIAIGRNSGKLVRRDYSVFVGADAGNQGNSGQYQVFVGKSAGTNNTGNFSVAIGANSNRFSNGIQSVGIGYQTLYNNGGNGSNYVVAIGSYAGEGQSGTHNTLLGQTSARYLNGSYNSAIGFRSGYSMVGDYNVTLGFDSGYDASGSKNIILGYQAGYNLTGSNQLIIANNSSSALVTGDFANNTFNISGSVSASTYYGDGSNLTGIDTDPFPYTGSAVISGSLKVIGDITGSGKIDLNDGNNSVYIGELAGNSNNNNTFIGYDAGGNSSNSVAIGYQAGRTATNGNNVYIGYQTGDNAEGGTYRVALGAGAGTHTRANHEISIGRSANRFGTGESSIAIGRSAAYGSGANTKTNLIAIGQNTGYGSDGTYNTHFQLNSGRNTTGNYNITLGANSGYTTTGDYNIILGTDAGYTVSGSNNILLGYQAGYNLTGSNQLIIANNSSSALVTGDFENNTFNISGSVSASTYYGDGSNLTGIDTDPFPYTGDVIITGSNSNAASASLEIVNSNKHPLLSLKNDGTLSLGHDVLNTTTGNLRLINRQGDSWMGGQNTWGNISAGIMIQSEPTNPLYYRNLLFYVKSTQSAIAGVEKMRLDYNGNLGIGVSSPQERLHVNGNAVITGSNSLAGSYALKVANSSGNNTLLIENDNDVVFNSRNFEVYHTNNLYFRATETNRFVNFAAPGKTPITFNLNTGHQTLVVEGNTVKGTSLISTNGIIQSFSRLEAKEVIVAGIDASTSGQLSVPIRPGRSLGNQNNVAGLDLTIQGGQGTGTGVGGDIIFQVKSEDGGGTQSYSILSDTLKLEASTMDVHILSGSLTVSQSVSASTYYGDGSNLTGIDSGSWDGIFTGSAEITGSLEVIGDITTNTLSNISTTLASDSATNVDTFNTASYTGAIYDYILVDATVGARAGQFMVAHDNGNITFTDTSTKHLTDPVIPEISAQINGADVEVQVTNGNGYTFKSFVKKL